MVRRAAAPWRLRRKPRGALIAPAGGAFVVRFSLCCGREASLVAQALGTAEASRHVTGVPARTTKRWLGWWRGPFLSTAVLVEMQARLVGVDTKELPASIVSKLPGTWQQRVRVVLESLAPLTTGSLPAGSPFLRGTA